jgi:hypothetical protein
VVLANARWGPIVRRFAPVLAALAAAGCGGDEITLPAQGVPAKITIVGGNGQSEPVASVLPDRLVVRVTDSRDQPVANQPVTFSAAGGGSMSPATATTAADGTASAQWTLRPTAGVQQATARVTGEHAPPNLTVSFSASGLTAAPTKVEKVAGDGQSAAAGTAVVTAPAVKVTDVGGNPVANVLVTYQVTGGEGVVAPTTPIATDAGGVATVTSWTLGNEPGQNLLKASISGSGVTGNPAVFMATGQVGTANKLFFITQPSNVSVGAAISPAVRVQVQDAAGNAVGSATDVIAISPDNFSPQALSGGGGLQAISGVATFGNLRVSIGGNGFRLRAHASGLIDAVSGSFNVTNPPPTASNDAYSTNEDAPLNVAAPGVLGNDSDPNGDPITAVKLTDPAHGSVTLRADSSFTYTPQPNFSGSDAFTYAANDGGSSSNPATVTITVNPVNDPPSFSLPDADDHIDANAGTGPQTVGGWVTSIDPGPGEGGQTVTFTVTNDNPGAFTPAGQPAIDAAGTLTYEPQLVLVAPTTATVTVTAKDNGGTANGGQDTSAPQQFTITVNP